MHRSPFSGSIQILYWTRVFIARVPWSVQSRENRSCALGRATTCTCNRQPSVRGGVLTRRWPVSPLPRVGTQCSGGPLGKDNKPSRWKGDSHLRWFRYELFESSKRTTARRETTPQGFVPSYLQMVDYTANGCEMVVKYTVYIHTAYSIHITVNYIQHKTEVVIYWMIYWGFFKIWDGYRASWRHPIHRDFQDTRRNM